jgi:hypothetical protein
MLIVQICELNRSKNLALVILLYSNKGKKIMTQISSNHLALSRRKFLMYSGAATALVATDFTGFKSASFCSQCSHPDRNHYNNGSNHRLYVTCFALTQILHLNPIFVPKQSVFIMANTMLAMSTTLITLLKEQSTKNDPRTHH